jgi:hypothetical protein
MVWVIRASVAADQTNMGPWMVSVRVGSHRVVGVIPGLQRGEVEVILFVLFPHSGDALWEFGICGKHSPVRQ